MFGEEKVVAERGATGGVSDGIVPRLLRDIFSWVRSSHASDIIRAVRMSCIQIYCEKVRAAWMMCGAWFSLRLCLELCLLNAVRSLR